MEQNKDNGHSHGGHSHNYNTNKKVLLTSFTLIAGFMLVEFIGGFLTNSLALISDAGHMLSDAVALGLSLSALIFSAKAATPSKSYGYKRTEILAALLNGLILIVLSIFICIEAVKRISSPPQVIGSGMMVISFIGLVINIIVAWTLHKQASLKENLNLRSAFLHVIGDLLGSVGAITAAILIIFFNWYIADPIASIIVSLLILYSGWNVLKESVHVLMESKPANIDTNKVIDTLKSVNGVKDVHDLHIWMITPEFTSMTVHLQVDTLADRDSILEKSKELIYNTFKLRHVTIQIEGRELHNYEEGCN